MSNAIKIIATVTLCLLTINSWAQQPPLQKGRAPHDIFAPSLVPASPSSVISPVPARSVRSGPAAPSPSPAQLGITPTTIPEVVQVLDNTKTWVPWGSIDPVNHWVSSIATPGTIYMTGPEIGMKSSQTTVFDNAPLLSKYNSVAGDRNFPVIFPAIFNDQAAYYYFSQTLHKAGSGLLSCQNTDWTGQQTALVFAPGVDGVSFDNYWVSPTHQWSEGVLDGCKIVSLGKGTGFTADGANFFTGISMSTYGNIPATTWEVGDGIIATGGGNGFITPRYPNVTPIKHGAYVSAIGNDPVYGLTLTLGNGYTSDVDIVNTKFGNPYSPTPWFITATSTWHAGDTTIHVDNCGPFKQGSGIIEAAYSPTVLLGTVEACSGTILTLSNINGNTGALVGSSGPTDRLSAGFGSVVLRLPVELGYHVTSQGPIDITATAAWSAGATTIKIPNGSCEGILTGALLNGYGAPLTLGASVYDYSIDPANPINAPYLGTVKSCSGTTLTFNSALPASAGANDSLTLVSRMMLISGGNGSYIGESDYLWTDAFDFGNMSSRTTYGSPANGGTEVLEMEGADAYPKTYGNAWPVSTPWGGQDPRVKPCPLSTPDSCIVGMVTHTSGSGVVWRLPSGFHKRVTSDTHNINPSGFFIGYTDIGQSEQGAAGKDYGNYIVGNLIGRVNGGDDIAPNNEYSGIYGGNTIFDILSIETINGTSWGTNTNSAEGGSAFQSLAGGCTYLHVFLGMYSSDSAAWLPSQTSYCIAQNGGISVPPMPGYKTILNGGAGYQDWSAQQGATQAFAVSGATINQSYLGSNGSGGATGFNIGGAPNVQPVTSSSPVNQAMVSGITNYFNLYPGLGVRDVTNLNAIPPNTIITSFLSASQIVLSANLTQDIQANDQLEFYGPICFNLNGPGSNNLGIYSDKDCSSVTQVQYTYYGNYYGGVWGWGPGRNHTGPAIAFPGYYFGGESAIGKALFPQGVLMGGGDQSVTKLRSISVADPEGPTYHTTGLLATRSFNTSNQKIFVDSCQYPLTQNQQAVLDTTLDHEPVIGFTIPGYTICAPTPTLVLNANSLQASAANIDILKIGGVTINAADFFTTGNIAIPVTDCTGVTAGASVTDNSISGSPSIGTVNTCDSEYVVTLSERSAQNSSGANDKMWAGTQVPGTIRFRPNPKRGDPAGAIKQYDAGTDNVYEFPFGLMAGDQSGFTWPATTTPIDVNSLLTLECSSTNNLMMNAVVWNGLAAPTYLQPVTSTTGPSYRKVFCDGTNWIYN